MQKSMEQDKSVQTVYTLVELEKGIITEIHNSFILQPQIIFKDEKTKCAKITGKNNKSEI